MDARRYRNWPVHNFLAHPLSEAVYWVVLGVTRWESVAKVASEAIHDVTLPPKGTP